MLLWTSIVWFWSGKRLRYVKGGSPSFEVIGIDPYHSSRSHADTRRLALFFSVLAMLAVLRVVLGLVPVPLGWVPAASLLVTMFFVFVPIVALFRVAGHAWTPRLATGLLAGGVLVHVGLGFAAQGLLRNEGPVAAFLTAFAQAGLLTWCLGLGGLLATMIREKNMLLPIAIFLAGFDIFLVLTPAGPTKYVVENRPEILQAVAYQVPSVGTAAPLAYIGPADFLFLGAFFIALFRFQMQTKRAFYWMVPTLIVYLLTVVLFGSVRIGGVALGALPALVPIGFCVMLTNLREFRLSRDEKWATLVVALLAVGIVVFGATRPTPVRDQGAVPKAVSPASGDSA
ncbi:MAG: hypothetical protein KIS66_09640 [Fimbriimonadaceae bacterium]|nr:hypothetical protein [Fimbriimonadaceae bacterium]